MELQRLSDKHLEMFLVMCYWVQHLQRGKRIKEFLTSKGYRNISIYGMSYMGKCLYEELKMDGAKIVNLIDKNTVVGIDGMEVKKAEDLMEKSDVVIVTSIYYFEEIVSGLKGKFDCPVISLADIIYKM